MTPRIKTATHSPLKKKSLLITHISINTTDNHKLFFIHQTTSEYFNVERLAYPFP